MDNLGVIAAFTSLILIIAIACSIFDIVLESTGYYWYVAARREIVANMLNGMGISRESKIERAKRSIKSGSKIVFSRMIRPLQILPSKDADNEFNDKVQEFLKQAEETSSSNAQIRCIDSLVQLKEMTGRAPKHDPSREVYLSLKNFCSEIEGIKFANLISRDDILFLIKEEGLLVKYSWIKERWQPGYFLPLIRDFIDYAGRGTTIGLFIGFTIALIQQDPFGVVTTAIPIVGAIIGAISFLVKLDLAKSAAKELNIEGGKTPGKIILNSIGWITYFYLTLGVIIFVLRLLYGIASKGPTF